LKLSGESLQGKQGYGLDPEMLASYARQIKAVAEGGTQVGIVIGGGNIFRGMTGVGKGFDRVRGDQMGMLATVINSLALQSAIENAGGKACVLTSIPMGPVGAGIYSKFRAIELMNDGYVVIIGGGTGNPFFTTDTASALRGVEIEADLLLKGTRVNGVYTADPEKDPTATKYDAIRFAEVIEKRLKVMDLTAFTLCMENDLPIFVFDMDTPGNLERVAAAQGPDDASLRAIGTLVHN
jgi:uridylate kinase